MQASLRQVVMTPHKLVQQLSMHIGSAATLFPRPEQGQNFEGTLVAVALCRLTADISVTLKKTATPAAGVTAPGENGEKVVSFVPSSVKLARFTDTTDRLVVSGDAFGLLVIEPVKRK